MEQAFEMEQLEVVEADELSVGHPFHSFVF
jgi:hypothetical protein